MPSEPQNLSREMILPAYKAAISPGPPILPLTRIENRPSRHLPSSSIKDRESSYLCAYKAAISSGPPILPSHYESRATSHESRITSRLNPRNPAPKVKMYEGLRTNLSANCAKRTQFPKHPKSPQTQSPQRITQKQPLRQDPKTNPNEPKRTQNKPNFSLINAPQSQNEPKRTQNKPNLSRRSLLAAAKCFTKPGWRSRIETKKIRLLPAGMLVRRPFGGSGGPEGPHSTEIRRIVPMID